MGLDGATESQGAKWCPVPYVVSVTGRLNPSPLTPPPNLTPEQRGTDAGTGGLGQVAWLRPQGQETPTEVNLAWCRGRHII